MKTISEKNVSKLSSDLTLENLVNGRIYIKGWQDVRFDEEFYNKSIDELVELIGGRKETKNKVRFNLRNMPFSHWSGRRFIYSSDRKAWEYVAGQDYVSEISTIRNYIKNT